MWYIVGTLVFILFWFSLDYYEMSQKNKKQRKQIDELNRGLERQLYFVDKYHRESQNKERWIRDLQREIYRLRREQL